MPKDTTDVQDEKYLYAELESLSQKVQKIEGMPIELKDRLSKMLNRLNRMASTGGYAEQFDTVSRYIDTVASIPWLAATKDRLDLVKAKELLDKNHYALISNSELTLQAYH